MRLFRSKFEKEILVDLMLHLKPSRVKHILGVEKTAVKMARHYGENVQKARLAALLHDNAKFMSPEEMLEACGTVQCEEYGLGPSFEPVLHAFAGAERARIRFNLDDETILNAVRFHTTGRPKMTAPEQIILIADYIEPGREPFEGLETARELAYKDLNLCTEFILDQTVRYLQDKNVPIQPMTLRSYQYYQSLNKR